MNNLECIHVYTFSYNSMATAPTAASPITFESLPALFSICWETEAVEDGAAEVATLETGVALDVTSITEEEEATGAAAEEEATGAAAEEEVTGAAAEEEEAAVVPASTLAASNSGANLEEYHGNLDKKGPKAATSTSLYNEV